MSIRYGIKYGDFEECPRCFAVVHSDNFDKPHRLAPVRSR